MIQFYKCTRCGRIVEIDLKDGCVPRCTERRVEYVEFSDPDPDILIEICGGRLEKASKGENDVQEQDFIN
jgi:Fe-S-cluster-containing dehydrogenase component